MQHLVHLRDLFSAHPLFSAGALLLVGFLLARLIERFKIPEITGFILTGLILGSSGLGVVSLSQTHNMQFVTELALGMIAITIGGEFSLGKLKSMGSRVIIMALLEMLGAFLFVTVGAFAMGLALPFALLLGAIASATAPAATVAIVQSMRAKGKFVDYLYGIVALDDVGAVLIFGLAFGVASAMLGSGGLSASILHALLDVALSILMGAIMGLLLHTVLRYISKKSEIILVSFGALFVSIAVSSRLNLSALLVNMMIGAFLINLSSRNKNVFQAFSEFSPLVYALFFLIAGTELNPSVLFNGPILALGIVYILTRALGKYTGVYLACRIARTESKIAKNMGFCLMPQAGVALGLAMMVEASPLKSLLPASQVHIVGDMVNIILMSVFVNELIGPAVSRFGLLRGLGLKAAPSSRWRERRARARHTRPVYRFSLSDVAAEIALQAERQGIIQRRQSPRFMNHLMKQIVKVAYPMQIPEEDTIEVLSQHELTLLCHNALRFDQQVLEHEFVGDGVDHIIESITAEGLAQQIAGGEEELVSRSVGQLFTRPVRCMGGQPA